MNTPPIPTNVNINIAVNPKALVLIGVTVFVAAKSGARKAIRKEFRRQNGQGVNPVVLFNQLKDVLKEEGPVAAAQHGAETVWAETTDSPKAEGNGQYDTPSVQFDVPQQPTTSPGDEPTPPAGVGG